MILISKDKYSRKWLVTINNPVEHGFNREWLRGILGSFKKIVYWCMADEIGENGTYHTHIFMAFSTVQRFSTIQKKFNGGHIDYVRGTSQQNRDYIFKEGEHAKTKKKEGHLEETREEYGQMPIERPGARNDIHDVMDMIENGMSDVEILKENPQFFHSMDKLDKYRQKYREDKYQKVWRTIEVTYIYGQTGTGKTRGIMDKYGYENVYRVTDYDHPFDSYKGQDVILLDEFASSLKIRDMLMYLEGYPINLPARYNNKVACFTKVYIVSNLPLCRQYENMQTEHPETFRAFLRRIGLVQEYKDGEIIDCTVEQEIPSYIPLPKDTPTPFDKV